MQANMFKPSNGTNGYMDKFGGEGFHEETTPKAKDTTTALMVRKGKF